MLVRQGSASGRLWAPDAASRAILDAVPTPLALVDGNGHLAYCNPSWRDLAARTTTFGELGTLVTPLDVEGSAYPRRLAAQAGPLADPAHRLAQAIQDVLAGRSAGDHIPYQLYRPEGHLAAEARVGPVARPGGTLALVQHLDLSSVGQAEAAEAALGRMGIELEDARAAARRTSRRLEAFDRELQMPITPVQLELHLLASGALGRLTRAQKHALDIIQRNVRRWADAEHAVPGLAAAGWRPAAPTDLARLAAQAVDGRHTQALQQGVDLGITSSNVALPIVASPDQVVDVLDLFLARALAATPAGGSVSVTVEERDGEAVVEVRDRGSGLTPREQRAFWEPWQGRRPRVEADQPYLLAYVQRSIAASGGRAFVSSDGPHSGVSVGIAFPLAQAGGQAAA